MRNIANLPIVMLTGLIILLRITSVGAADNAVLAPPPPPAATISPAMPAAETAKPTLLELPVGKVFALPEPTNPSALPANTADNPALPDSSSKTYIREIVPPKLLTVDPVSKQQVLEEPITIKSDFSIMFSQKDMVTLVMPSLEIYDKAAQKITEKNPEGGDDLSGLLESLKIDRNVPNQQNVQPQIPNIYLGSIVYYSPSNWSIWINGKKIVNRINSDKNVMHVSAIDRTRATLVWKPTLFKEFLKTWNARKQAGPEESLRYIKLDETQGKVIFTLHPNQTFVPKAMVIREGLITQTEDATPVQTAPSVQNTGESTVFPVTPMPIGSSNINN